MEDDSDSSDIDNLLQAVHQRKKQRCSDDDNDDDDDDDDDEEASAASDDEDDSDSEEEEEEEEESAGNPKNQRSTRRNSGQRRPLRHTMALMMTTETADPLIQKLALLEQNKLIRQRARAYKLHRSSLDSDDSDAENMPTTAAAGSSRQQQRSLTCSRMNDVNAVKVHIETQTEEDYLAGGGVAAKKKDAVDLLESSDDDDDDDEDDQHNNKNQPCAATVTNATLTSLRKASASLVSAQRYQANDNTKLNDSTVIDLDAPEAAYTSTLLNPASASANRYINLTVTAKVFKFGSSLANEADTKTSTHAIGNWQLLKLLRDGVLSSLGLTAENAVVVLVCHCDKNNKNKTTTLLVRKTPLFYKLDENSNIEARVTLTGMNAFLSKSTTSGATSSATATKPAAAKAASTANLGKAIVVTLKQQKTERPISIHIYEPLQVLVDKYRKQEKQNIAATQKIALKFDGETVVLTRTPASYDMEDEDQIDVTVT